jgi:cellulose synthase operon protein C
MRYNRRDAHCCFESANMRKAGKCVKCILSAIVFTLLIANFSSWKTKAAESGSGKNALRSGDYVKARDLFEAALKDSAATDEIQAGLLQTLRETGSYAEAVKRSEEFLSLSDSSLLHLERGRVAEIVGDYPNAEKHYRRSISLAAKRTPLFMDATRDLALLLKRIGRRKESVAFWDQLLDEYRSGTVQGSQSLGDIAVAAWNRGYVEDAKDIFMDATDEKLGGEISLEALTNFGYLFLDKYRITEALSVFRDCLKINKYYPDALIGIALAKKYEDNLEVEAYARAALKINPNSIPALNLLAELALDEENLEAAKGEIDKSLSVNPSDLASLSLKAVYLYFRSDVAGFAQNEKRILELNPAYGNFYYILAENCVSRRKYHEAVEFNRKAVALDPELWAAYNSLGMNLTRIGQLEEGRKAIETAFAGDQSNVWAFNSLDLFDQMDGFARDKSEHFNFLISKEDEPALLPYASKLAEEAYANLTQRYGFVPNGRLQVEIFPDHGGFEIRTLGVPGLEGALGVCFGKVLAIYSPRKSGEFNWGSALWHEFTHVITLQMSNYNIPRWFSEGLSVYEEHRARPGWGDGLTLPFIKAYKEGKLLKASQLNAGIMRPQSPEQIMFSYYQAGMFCEMIEKKLGFDKLKESLKLFAENRPAEEVFRLALGLDSAGIDAEYSRYIDSQMMGLASHINLQSAGSDKGEIDKGALTQFLEENPEDFLANLRLGELLLKEGSNAAAEACLKKAQKIFPQYSAPGNPYQLLGQMYLESKREDRALSEFVAWSKVNGESTAPLLKAADIYAGQKDWASVARMLMLSTYIHPYDQDIQKRLGEAAMESGQWAEAIAAYQVLVGLNATDRAGAHYDLARAYFASGNKQQAKREVLRALEAAPSFRKAQGLLLKINGETQ